MLELYHSPGACSLAPHIVLHEIGAPHRLHLVSVADGETGSPEYLSINPKGRVPALRLPSGAPVLTEVPAILVYLARQAPGRELLGPGDAESEARCLEWLAWLSSHVHAVGFGGLWRPLRFVSDPAHVEDATATARSNVEAAFAMIEERLGDGREAAVRGTDFTVADALLLVFYRWGRRIGLAMERYPGWSRLAAKACRRPTVRRAFEVEGLPLPVELDLTTGDAAR